MKKQLQKIKYAMLCVMLMLPSINVNAQEQMLLGWQFLTSGAGANGVSLGNESTYNSTSQHAGVNTSVLSRGVGLRPYALATAFSAVPDVKTPDAESAITEKAFYELSFQPKAGYKMSLSQLNFKLRTSGTWSLPSNATPLNFIWKYSLNNGATFTDIGTVIQFPAAVQDIRQPTVVLSDILALQKLPETTTVIFRLYVWGFTNNPGSGTFSIGRSTAADPIALSLSGTAYPLNPISTNLTESYFTDTKEIALGKASEVIMDKLISSIENTPADEDIHLSIYLINHQGVMDALKAAEVRGVNLHIIVDMSRSDSQITNASSLPWLQANLPNSEIIVSVNDVSPNAINHHKFALFSKMETPDGVLQNVTFQTSHNFTVSDTKKVQDALVFNNPDIYQAFLTNWQTIKTYAASGMGQNYVYNTFSDNVNGVKLAFFPKIGAGVITTEDDIVQNLNAITDVANAKIRIAMSDWADSRPAIVDKLIQLRNQGAAIEVYARDAAGNQTKVKLGQLAALGAIVRIFNTETGSDAKFNIHAKMMLIEGIWEGQANAKVIITGSHNYTDGALKTNNEVLVTLKNSDLFPQYTAYFDQLRTVVPMLKLIAFDLSAIGSGQTATYNSTFASGLFPSTISRGTGLKITTLSGGFSSGKVVVSSRAGSVNDAITRDEYFEFSITPKPGKKVSISRISAVIRRTGGGSSTMQWAYVLNGGTPVIIPNAISVPVYANGGPIDDINVANVAALQNLTANSNVVLRLYMFGETTDGGTFALGQSSTTTPEVLVISGDLESVEDDKVILAWGAAPLSGEVANFMSTQNNAAVTSTTMTRGSGLEASSLNSAFSSRTNRNIVFTDVTDKATAIANNSYLEFSLNVKAGYKVSLETIYAKLRRSGAGAKNYSWSYSIDDAEFVDITPTPVSFTTAILLGTEQTPVDLSSIAALQNIAAAKVIKFRIYSWGYTSAAGTFALGLSNSSSEDVLTITGTTVNALPVSLTSFEAKKTNNSVNLTWETASEQNNSHFDVLKSFDGKNWQLLTSVLGSANSNKVVKYSSTDHHPAFGANYYQLKQVDFDGTSSLSKIEVVNFNVDTKESLKVNYADNTLKLFVNKTLAEQTEIVIYSVDGRKVSAKTTFINHGSSVIVLPTTLAKGVYLVKIKSSNSELTEKFIAN